MCRILAIGDQHFTTKNIQEIENFIQEMTKIAVSLKPDIIVLMGDLLHTHEKLHTTPLNKAYEFIRNMRDIALTFILVGNHDYINASQFLTDNHWLNSMKEWRNVIIVDKIVQHRLLDENNTLLVFAPYVEPERFVEALDTIEGDWKEASLIFCHQEFFGCNMNGNYVSDKGKWDLSYPQVIAGHIHTKQHLQKNIYYTGSSMETEWKDSVVNSQDYNTIALITTSATDGSHSIEEIEVKLHRKLKIRLAIEDLESFVIPEVKEDTTKIVISGIPIEEFNTLKKSAKYKELLEKEIKVDFEFNKKEIKVNNEKLQAIIDDTSLNDFRSIFESIAKQNTDSVYYEIKERVMNDRIVKADNILIL